MQVQTESVAEARHPIKEMEVMVADVIHETSDTTTLVLFTGNDRLDYKPGHFLVIDPHQFDGLERFIGFLEDLKEKKEPPRAYSMSSAPHERYLAITVKEERYISGVTKYPPLLSPLLVRRIQKGTKLVVTGFTGPYTLPRDIESRTNRVVHVCAGSGSVPNFSILKHALEFHPNLKHRFIYSNRTWEEVIFREALEAMQREHPNRLQVFHTLTRETDPSKYGRNVFSGRLSEKLLRNLVADPADAYFYVCGPAVSAWDRKAAAETGTIPAPRFLESTLTALANIGVPQNHIVRESYG